MSQFTPHTHLGFAVRIDELEQDNAIAMSSKTYAALKKTQDGVDWTVKDLRQVLDNTRKQLAAAEIKIAGLSKDKPAK